MSPAANSVADALRAAKRELEQAWEGLRGVLTAGAAVLLGVLLWWQWAPIVRDLPSVLSVEVQTLP